MYHTFKHFSAANTMEKAEIEEKNLGVHLSVLPGDPPFV